MTWRKLSLHWTASAFSCEQYSAQNRRETAVEAPNAQVFKDLRFVISKIQNTGFCYALSIHSSDEPKLNCFGDAVPLMLIKLKIFGKVIGGYLCTLIQ